MRENHINKETFYYLSVMNKTNLFWIKAFTYLAVASVILYFVLRIITALFNIDTNIDTGNPVFSMMYVANFVLFTVACLGLVVAVFAKVLKKLF